MFSASQEELELVADILTFTNSQDSRVLTTDAAVDVFKRSGLSDEELREIWRYADSDRNGRLNSKKLAVAVRLMGWVQVGEPLADTLLDLPGPLPTLEGISDVPRTHGPSLIPIAIRNASPSLPPLPVSPLIGTEEPQTPIRSAEASTSRSPRQQLRPLPRQYVSAPSTSTIQQPPAYIGFPSSSILAAAFLTNTRSESRAAESRPLESRDAESRSTESRPTESHSVESRSTESRPTESQSVESKSTESRLAESRPIEPRAIESTPTESRPTSRPTESRSAESRPSNPFLSAPSPAEMREEIRNLKAHLETSRKKNEDLEMQISDMEIAMSQVLLATEHGGLAVSDDAAVSRLTVRITELEEFEREVQRSTNLLKQAEQETEGLRKQLEDKGHDMQKIIDDKDREINRLKTRVSEAEEAKNSVERTATANAERLSTENSRLAQNLADRERTLGKEAERLQSRVQELEVLVAELQWSETEVNLQRVIQDVTTENDQLKARTTDLISSMAQQRTTHESEVVDLKRQLAESRQESARLALSAVFAPPRHPQARTRAASVSVSVGDAPPPAYDDNYFSDPSQS